MTRTLLEIIYATIPDVMLQNDLIQELLREGYALEPPIPDGSAWRGRGIATIVLDTMPGVDDKVGRMYLKANLNVQLDAVIHEGRVWDQPFGFSDPDRLIRYNVSAVGFTVPMDDGKTHMIMRQVERNASDT